jgi:hypothetical protein
MRPGDLVVLDIAPGGGTLNLWHFDTTRAFGSIRSGEVGLILSRVPSKMGVPGTETDQLLLLFGTRLGWNSAYWFREA